MDTCIIHKIVEIPTQYVLKILPDPIINKGFYSFPFSIREYHIQRSENCLSYLMGQYFPVYFYTQYLLSVDTKLYNLYPIFAIRGYQTV